MKVVYTDEALHNLDEILGSLRPTTQPSPHRSKSGCEPSLRGLAHGQRVRKRSQNGRAVVPFIRYPYKVFYRVTNEAVEILYIHHAARRQPWEGER